MSEVAIRDGQTMVGPLALGCAKDTSLSIFIYKPCTRFVSPAIYFGTSSAKASLNMCARLPVAGDNYWQPDESGEQGASSTEHINQESRRWSAANAVLVVLQGSCSDNPIVLCRGN